MRYLGNRPSIEVVQSYSDKWDFINTTDPTSTTNPPTIYSTWLNITNGSLFVCTDNTVGANVWIALNASLVLSVTDLGALGATATLDMANENEAHYKATLGSGATTFALSNVPTGVIGAVLDLAVGGTLGALTFTDATPVPTLEINKNYRLLWTRNQITGLYSLDMKELV